MAKHSFSNQLNLDFLVSNSSKHRNYMVLLLKKCGAIFLHIPKTGGSWVSRVLWECDLVEKRLGYKHEVALM